MADKDNELLHFVSEENDGNEGEIQKKKWKIIVADDDVEVHAVTALALTGFQFKGRGLEIYSTYSAEETKKVIKENPDTAVILLDVVMEHHDSGLQLVKFIREEAGNTMVRIILRTGQPGYAPEMEVIYNYDINGYKEKTELTSARLVTTLIASIRNFDDLFRIEENRKSLEIFAGNSAEMHGLNREKPFDIYITESLSDLIGSFVDEKNFSILNGCFYESQGRKIIERISGTGEFSFPEKIIPEEKFSCPDALREKIEESDGKDPVFYDKDCAICLSSPEGVRRFLYIKDMPPLNEIRRNILKIFSTNLNTVYENLGLMEEQKRKEDEIRKSLDEKLILVKEIHHRVKNNLQIISSLLHMQSTGLEDEKLLEVLRESENRVQSMSLVHEKLYQSDLMATIDFPEYLGSLAERLISTYSVRGHVELSMDTDPLMLSINTAIPCGLIVNEILTNALKYAFPDGRNGRIFISLKTDGTDIALRMGDNGIGLPDGFDSSKSTSLGMKLIRVLTDQIDGEMSILSDGGITYELTFTESGERES